MNANNVTHPSEKAKPVVLPQHPQHDPPNIEAHRNECQRQYEQCRAHHQRHVLLGAHPPATLTSRRAKHGRDVGEGSKGERGESVVALAWKRQEERKTSRSPNRGIGEVRTTRILNKQLPARPRCPLPIANCPRRLHLLCCCHGICFTLGPKGFPSTHWQTGFRMLDRTDKGPDPNSRFVWGCTGRDLWHHEPGGQGRGRRDEVVWHSRGKADSGVDMLTFSLGTHITER